MIRCSAFCVSLDSEHARRARRAALKLDRASKGDPVRFESGAGEVVVLPLEGEGGLPVVHGWTGPGADDGECTKLFGLEGGLGASRDSAGTRPLYLARSGRWAASDHRFFPGEEQELLPPGTTVILPAGSRTYEEAPGSAYRGSFEEAGDLLASMLEGAVRERVAHLRKVAVAFSGGLDSSILAFLAKKHTKVVAVTVHSVASRDSAAAPAASEALGVELIRETPGVQSLGAELAALDLPFSAGRMDRSLFCIYSIASRTAAEAGAEAILLGQLADETFGGYMKYQRALSEEGPRASAEMMREDVAASGMRGFLRDEAACSRWLEPRFPYADGTVLRFGLGLPVEFKIRGGERKAVLRQAARRLGVPEELCDAPKKAAQYSSGVQRLLP